MLIMYDSISKLYGLFEWTEKYLQEKASKAVNNQ